MSLLLDEIWSKHTVLPPGEDREALIYVDRCFVHEESRNAFREGASTVSFHRPRSTLGFVDHYAPTGNLASRRSDAGEMIDALQANAQSHGLMVFGLDHPARGIMHVVAPEQGLVLPGMLIVGSDSHSCTNGAFGALSFGAGQSELTQIFETQTLWRTRPSCLHIRIEGWFNAGVGVKDLIVRMIGERGANSARGGIVEFSGPCVSRMSMEQRMTLCNMAIEMGALSALIAPDETTLAYLAACPLAPKGEMLDRAAKYWRKLAALCESAENAWSIDAAQTLPMVSWGTSLEDVSPIDGTIPDPQGIADPAKRKRIENALRYMDLKPGTPVCEIPIDIAFVGSCTNGRIQDLREAAKIIQGQHASVPAFVSPGSRTVKRQAEAEGLRDIFERAGFAWLDSGCSMCVGSNGDVVGRFQRCASSSPRNFEGRQGPGARTHIMSPQMAVYAAIRGRISDVRGAIQ